MTRTREAAAPSKSSPKPKACLRAVSGCYREGLMLKRISDRGSEQGSVLIVALMVMIIMTLLGMSFALSGQMESRIALNQRDAEQTLQVAEGGVRIVRSWFDAPSGAGAYR